MTISIQLATLVAALVVLISSPSNAHTFVSTGLAFGNAYSVRPASSLPLLEAITLRGGATVEDDEIEFESSDEEVDSEEEEDFDPKLAKSTQTAASNARTKAAKAAISEVVSTKKSSGSTVLKLLSIPYIVKACLSPFTLIKMTQGYFASLFNLNYLSDNVDTSQELRNALTEKAKKSSSSGGSRGKRKFKPGQAKVSGWEEHSC